MKSFDESKAEEATSAQMESPRLRSCRLGCFVGGKRLGKLLARLVDKKDVIAAIKDLFTIGAAVIALVSIWVASKQLSTTAASIKSNTVYQISREGREVSKTITPNMAADKIGPVVNFMHSVWNQHRFGSYDAELWTPFREEVCAFLKSQSNFDEYWQRNRTFFAPGFVSFLDERRKQCA